MLKLVTLLLAAAVCLAFSTGEATLETDTLDISQPDTSVNEADKTDARIKCKWCFRCYEHSGYRCKSLKIKIIKCCKIGRFCVTFKCKPRHIDADEIPLVTDGIQESIKPADESMEVNDETNDVNRKYCTRCHHCKSYAKIRGCGWCCVRGRGCYRKRCWRDISYDQVFNVAAPAEEYGGKRRCRICNKCVKQKRVPGCGMCCDHWKGGSCKIKICERQD